MNKRNTPPLSPLPQTQVCEHRGTQYQVSLAHPVADCYQRMSADGIVELAASIKRIGLKQPIGRLPDGRIIDGRNRELACLVAGVKPLYEQCNLTDLAAIISHIRTANDDRRHSSPSQRAMTAARLTNLNLGSNQYAPKVGGAQAPPTSLREIAKQFRVSRDLVKRSRTVLQRGEAELVTAVDNNCLDVTPAARVARLPAHVQRAVVAANNPKAAALRALRATLSPPTPTTSSPLVPDGATFIRITPDIPTVGSLGSQSTGPIFPGIPEPFTDGQVWRGRYLDVRRGVREAYLIPGFRWGWYVVVFNEDPDEWHTSNYALRPYAAMNALTNPERFDFDVWAAYWQPSTRFTPSAVNPLYTDPDYAPTQSKELKQFVADETRREAERQAQKTNALDGAESAFDEIPY